MDKTTKITQLSMFNLPKFGRKTLAPVHQFHKLIGKPSEKFKSIHVAGTNGKGSVWYKLAKATQWAGFKTGLYISPHLVKFNERISINGTEIPDDDLFRIEKELIEVLVDQEPQPELGVFDMMTMIAFKYFEEQKVDYAVVEVGIGGTLDPTNIINPEISVITSIGYDHMEILGNTLEEISWQKMGIAKPNTPMVIGPDSPQSYMKEYLKIERNMDESLIHLITKDDESTTDYQKENYKIIKTCLDLLDPEHEVFTEDVLEQAKHCVPPGRLQKFEENIYYDGAHNPPGIKKAISTLMKKLSEEEKPQKLVVVCCFVSSAKLTNNLKAILESEWANNISHIIFADCNNEPPQFVNYLPSCLPVTSLIEQLSNEQLNRKIWVFNTASDGSEGLISVKELLQSKSETPPVEELEKSVTGDITKIFPYLHSNPSFTDHTILVTGSFRLYPQIVKINNQ